MTTWYPHKTVATVVERQGRFLMVEENVEGSRVFNQPAGHLEAGETLLEAALRETLEETAWEVELLNFVGLYHYYSPVNRTCYVRSCFSARALSQRQDLALDTDIVAAHWLTRDEIRELGPQLRSPVVVRVVDDYLAGRLWPLSVVTSL